MRMSLREITSESDGITVDVWFNPDFNRITVKPINPIPPALRYYIAENTPLRRDMQLTWRDGTVEIKVSLTAKMDEADRELLQLSASAHHDEYGDVWAVFGRVGGRGYSE